MFKRWPRIGIINALIVLPFLLMVFVQEQANGPGQGISGARAPGSGVDFPLRNLREIPSSVDEMFIQEWEFELVDDPKAFHEMTDHSLALDANGHPHIAYGWDHLYYAHFDGAAWHYETVDNNVGHGGYTSIAVDPQGYPHILYSGYGLNSNYQLKYAYEDQNGWHHLEILRGMRGSMALDQDGKPHILFQSSSIAGPYNDLNYATLDATGWQFEVVDGSGTTDYQVSVALDADGFPHTSYHRFFESDLMYANRDSSGWHIQTVDNADDVGSSNSIDLDAAGHAHISYYDDTNSQLKYAHLGSNGWQLEVVDSTGNTGGYNSLAVDANGEPHISYYNFAHGDLMYAHQEQGLWNIQTVDSAGEVGWWTAMKLDASETVHISYYDKTYAELKYAFLESGAWTIEVVDLSRVAGRGSSLKLDAQGFPHISYVECVPFPFSYWEPSCYSFILKYARQDPTGWQLNTLDSVQSVSLALDLDENGYPHIGYAGAGLKYAYEDGDGWHYQTVDGYGRYVSLALDQNNNPHMSYATGAGLKYAYYDGSSWQITTVDSHAQDTSLALDSEGWPHIVYSSVIISPTVESLLKYAYQDSSRWHIQTVDSEPTVDGWTASLALDEDDRPHISGCFRVCGGHSCGCFDLRYAYHDGQNFQIQGINSTGRFNSLALDQNGNPHISFWGGGLHYIYRDSTGWHTSTVDSGSRGHGISLDFGTYDNPYISYFDYDRRALKLAFVPPPAPPQTVTIQGPSGGLADYPYALTAVISPTTASEPLTYTWQASGHPPLTHTGGLTDKVLFAWENPGPQVIEVTAANFLGVVTDTHVLTITTPTDAIFLPLVGKSGVGPSATQEIWSTNGAAYGPGLTPGTFLILASSWPVVGWLRRRWHGP